MQALAPSSRPSLLAKGESAKVTSKSAVSANRKSSSSSSKIGAQAAPSSQEDIDENTPTHMQNHSVISTTTTTKTVRSAIRKSLVTTSSTASNIPTAPEVPRKKSSGSSSTTAQPSTYSSSTFSSMNKAHSRIPSATSGSLLALRASKRVVVKSPVKSSGSKKPAAAPAPAPTAAPRGVLKQSVTKSDTVLEAVASVQLDEDIEIPKELPMSRTKASSSRMSFSSSTDAPTAAEPVPASTTADIAAAIDDFQDASTVLSALGSVAPVEARRSSRRLSTRSASAAAGSDAVLSALEIQAPARRRMTRSAKDLPPVIAEDVSSNISEENVVSSPSFFSDLVISSSKLSTSATTLTQPSPAKIMAEESEKMPRTPSSPAARRISTADAASTSPARSSTPVRAATPVQPQTTASLAIGSAQKKAATPIKSATPAKSPAKSPARSPAKSSVQGTPKSPGTPTTIQVLASSIRKTGSVGSPKLAHFFSASKPKSLTKFQAVRARTNDLMRRLELASESLKDASETNDRDAVVVASAMTVPPLDNPSAVSTDACQTVEIAENSTVSAAVAASAMKVPKTPSHVTATPAPAAVAISATLCESGLLFESPVVPRTLFASAVASLSPLPVPKIVETPRTGIKQAVATKVEKESSEQSTAALAAKHGVAVPNSSTSTAMVYVFAVLFAFVAILIAVGVLSPADTAAAKIAAAVFKAIGMAKAVVEAFITSKSNK